MQEGYAAMTGESGDLFKARLHAPANDEATCRRPLSATRVHSDGQCLGKQEMTCRMPD